MIYVHVPFCRSFCTYCDFYSEIACRGRDGEAFGHYADGVRDEAAGRREEIAGTLGTNTLYIGGGTPSVLPPAYLRRIVGAIRAVVPEPFTEFTVEVNPDDIVEKGTDYLSELRDMGVNRVSMGVQSLDDGVLRWMNRRHDAEGARRAFRLLRDSGFDNISVDVIFGINSSVPGGVPFEDALCMTLQEIVSWRPGHVSAYQLSIEEDSALGKLVAAGKYEEASDIDCGRQYATVCSMLKEAGYAHYEISNWALPGREAVHNSAYWTRAPYVGLGPGAHSLSADGSRRTWNSRALRGWTSCGEVLSPEEAREESIMLGLRTAAGIPETLVGGETSRSMLAAGVLERCGENVRIPESNFFVSDDIISSLL